MDEVRLLGSWRSGFCHRIIWALNFKGIEYDYSEEDLENKSDDLLLYNPIFQKVPVLVHNGKPIVESGIILEYIDEVWPQKPLFPQSPYEKAMARFWAKFMEDKSATFYLYFRAVGEEHEKLAKETRELLEQLEGEGLGNKKFFGGNEIGYADICLGWIACSLDLMQEAAGINILESDTFPRLHAWSKRFKELPIIKDNTPEDEKILDYFKEIRARFCASLAS